MSCLRDVHYLLIARTRSMTALREDRKGIPGNLIPFMRAPLHVARRTLYHGHAVGIPIHTLDAVSAFVLEDEQSARERVEVHCSSNDAAQGIERFAHVSVLSAQKDSCMSSGADHSTDSLSAAKISCNACRSIFRKCAPPVLQGRFRQPQHDCGLDIWSSLR